MKYDFYITGTIGVAFDWWTGQQGTTAKQVRNFLKEHKDEELTIAVSSPGGYLDEGIQIAEYIKDHGKCNMVIVGMTASAATVLCMKAKSVKIAKGSMMLIHNSSYMLDVWTSANKHGIDQLIEQFKKEREELDTFDKAIAEIYSTRNGKTLDENLAQMDKEQWMRCDDAKAFGLVDDILEDEESKGNATAINHVYASKEGLAAHFGLPSIPVEDGEQKPFRRFRDGLRSIMTQMKGIMNDADTMHETHEHIPTQNQEEMKKIILNLLCAVLAIKDIAIGEKGEATLTEDQLNALENALKEKDDRITALETERNTTITEKEDAVTAKENAEKMLSDLQASFDAFKKEAGGETQRRPADEGSQNPVNSTTMFNQIKDLL